MEVLSLLRMRHIHMGRRRKFNRILRSIVVGAVVTLFVVCVAVPLIFHYSPRLQRFFVFLHPVYNNIDFQKPEDVGLPGTRNFYLTTDKDVSVGIWHILPESLIHSAPKEISEEQEAWFEGSLKNDQPIILYLHGNKGSRGESHRVELYRILRMMDYHVFTFDYRGYADSSSVDPSENGLVTDTKTIFKYLLDNAGTSPVFVWGHSLGTGVSCHAVSELCRENNCPQGLILEAPFNNLHDEVVLNPLSQIFHHLPYFDWAFIEPLREIGIEFQSDIHIIHITCAVIILHAQDDKVVPIELGRKLVKAAQLGRPSGAVPIKFIELESSFGYGHNHISQAPEISVIIRDFVNKAKITKKI